MRKRTILVLVVGMALFGLGNGFQKQEMPTERYEALVRLVLVDVVATDKDGNFVQDLNREDFEVYEDGKKVLLDSFELVSFERGRTTPEEQEIYEYTSEFDREKRFIVIFDSINTIKRVLDQSKPEILEGLVALIKQGREVMVLELAEKEGMRILQPFTMNETLITQAVQNASGNIWIDEASDVLNVPRRIRDVDASVGIGEELGRVALQTKQSREVMYFHETVPRFEETVTGLLSTMTMLKDYPGRKSVLLVSGGIPEMSVLKIFGTFELSRDMAHSEIDLSKIHDPFSVLGKSGRKSGDQIIQDLIDFANSHNITLYTMDPDNYLRYVLPDVSIDNFPREVVGIRSAYPSDWLATIERSELSNLDFIAQETGGLSLQGAKKFENFKKVVDQDLSGYYELSYTPPRKKADGKYHKIKVEVKRPDLKIRYREGYYDYTDEQSETLKFASTFYNPSLFKDISFETWVYPFRQEEDKSILWFNIMLSLKGLSPADYDRGKSKEFMLKIWMVKENGDIDTKTEMTMPVVLTPEILQKLKGRPSYVFKCCSGELKLKDDRYRIISVLHDKELLKTGAYEVKFTLPTSQGLGEPQAATAFFGYLAEKTSGGGAFRVSGEDVSLLLSRYKFFPLELNIFRPQANVALLTQFFVPDKNTSIEPRFVLVQNGQEIGEVPADVIDKSWDKKTNLWSIVYKMDFQAVPAGSYILKISGNVNTAFLEADLRVRIF